MVLIYQLQLIYSYEHYTGRPQRLGIKNDGRLQSTARIAAYHS